MHPIPRTDLLKGPLAGRLYSGAKFASAVLCVAILSHCLTARKFQNPIKPDAFLAERQATGQELHNYRRAAEYSASKAGLSVLIIKNDAIVFEEYQNGHDASKPSHIFSGTKTFTGVLALALVAEGKLSLDERVSDTIAEFKNDPCKAKIRVRHLLHFTSGLAQNFLALSRDGMLPVEKQRVKNKYEFALSQPCRKEPGSAYSYGSVDHMVLGELIRRKIKESPLTYLKRRILDPLGLRYAGWHVDPSGNPALPYGAWTTAREWAKFGLFLRDGGQYKSRQILPSQILSQLTRGSDAMPAYGLSVWLNRSVPKERRSTLIPQLKHHADKGPVIYPQGLPDLFLAAGHNGQRLYVIPSKGMVVVRIASKDRAFDDLDFLSLLLGGALQE